MEAKRQVHRSHHVVAVLSLMLCLACQSVIGGSTPNRALNKPATLSSTLGSNVATNAVDGDKNGNMSDAGGSCAHTAGPSLTWQWWNVDLETIFNITAVQITNREDCCSDQLVNFTIEVTIEDPATLAGFPATTTGASVCLYRSSLVPAYTPIRFLCNEPVVGRYVRLVKFGDFALCEFEVYGDPVENTTTNDQTAAVSVLPEVAALETSTPPEIMMTTTTTTTVTYVTSNPTLPTTSTSSRDMDRTRGKLTGTFIKVKGQDTSLTQSSSDGQLYKYIFECARRRLDAIGIALPYIRIDFPTGNCRFLSSLEETTPDCMIFELLLMD